MMPRYMPSSWKPATAINATRLRPSRARVTSARTTTDTSECDRGTLTTPKATSSQLPRCADQRVDSHNITASAVAAA